MDLNRVMLLTDAHIVVEMEKLDLTKVFLPYNRLALNVMVMEKKLLIPAMIAMVKGKNRLPKKYL